MSGTILDQWVSEFDRRGATPGPSLGEGDVLARWAGEFAAANPDFQLETSEPPAVVSLPAPAGEPQASRRQAIQMDFLGGTPGPGGGLSDFQPTQTRRESDFLGGVQALGAGLSQVPEQMAATGLAAYQGGDVDMQQDWIDKVIEDAGTANQQVVERFGSDREFLPGLQITVRDLAEFPKNLAYSVVNLLAGAAVGIPAGLATANPIVGFGAGAAASGTVAYRMSKNEFLRRVRDAANETHKTEYGTEMPDEVWLKLRGNVDSAATKYGLWEAVPEAASNVIGVGIIAKPLVKIFGKAVATRTLGKVAGLYGEEMATETMTELGQHGAMKEVGLAEGDLGVVEAAKNVAPQVALLTTTLGGAGLAIKGGVSGVRKFDRNKVMDLLKRAKGEPQADEAHPTREQAIPDLQPEPMGAIPGPGAGARAPEDIAGPPMTTDEPVQGAGVLMPAPEEAGAPVVDEEAHQAATSPLNDLPEPTEGQKKAGNYQKGHTRVQGLDISIENPAGSVRRGTGKDGKPWETQMQHHYGYIKGTLGKDKDHIDIFLGPEAEATDRVFIVDQVDPETMKFDEHKVMLGFGSPHEAREAYLSNYEPGWQGLGRMTTMPLPEFKEWLGKGRRTKPASGFVDLVPKADPKENLLRQLKNQLGSGAHGSGRPLLKDERTKLKQDIADLEAEVIKRTTEKEGSAPEGVNVKTNGSPYTKAGIGLVVSAQRKKNVQAEAVEFAPGKWGWVDKGNVLENVTEPPEIIPGAIVSHVNMPEKQVRVESIAKGRIHGVDVQSGAQVEMDLGSAIPAKVAPRGGEAVKTAESPGDQKPVPGVTEAPEPAPEAKKPAVTKESAKLPRGVVGRISEETAKEVNLLGFNTKASDVVLPEVNAVYIEGRHPELSVEDAEYLKQTIEAPTEILPNIPTEDAQHRDQDVLFVRRNGKNYVSIVEVTPGGDGNVVWNFWKMKPKNAERYLQKFRQEKTRRFQSGGAAKDTEASDPSSSSLPAEVGVGKPEGLSGSQTEPSGEENITTTEGKGKVTAQQSRNLAAWVASRLTSREKFSWFDLVREANERFGGKQTDGAWTPKDAYDAMELGVNLMLSRQLVLNPNTPKIEDIPNRLEMIQGRVLGRIPTQTRRTEEMDEFQQFSTPPHLAYVVARLANIGENDVVLEPSAGTGSLGTFARLAGAREVVANELSPRRAGLLRESEIFSEVFQENAEHIHNILPKSVKPSVVLMNPPFSSTAGRVKGKRDTKNATKHIEQALARLEDEGRLVAILGKGMKINAPAFKKWWDGLKGKYNIRAVVEVDGSNYKKYGTTFDNVVAVIDKTGKTTDIPITGQVFKLEDLARMLEGVRSDRQRPEGTEAVSSPPDQRPRQKDAGEGGPVRRADNDARGSGVDALGGGKWEGGTSKDGVSGPAGDASELPRAQVQSGDTGSRRGAPRRPGRSPEVERPGGGRRDPDSEHTPVPGLSLVEESTQPTTERKSDLGDSIYDRYSPAVRIQGAKAHPGKLVESAAMAAVKPAKVSYSPHIPEGVIKSGNLSDAQIEAVVYAGHNHSQMIQNPATAIEGEERSEEVRKGFFIGDGTGVGKGREIAAILWDNWNQGRKKGMWVSKNQALFKDAQRDVEGVGWDKGVLFGLGKIKAGAEIPNTSGIMFATYDTIASAQNKENGKTRLDQIVEWLGKDFGGVIVFDETHQIGNSFATKGKRGATKPSKRGIAAADLRNSLPNARVVYVSATGATEPKNLGYLDRLGLWGPGTSFGDVRTFVNEVSRGGVASMELVAADMKAMGLYTARNLSFDGVTYDRLKHNLTKEQRHIYDTYAKAWRAVLNNVNDALTTTEADKNGDRKSSVWSAFWGANQRFWNQILTSLQMPTVIKDIEKQLEGGNSILVQLVNTNEAMLSRSLAEIEDASELEDLNLTPTEAISQFIEGSFPTQQFEEYMDENGNMRSRPVMDSQGNPVLNSEAVALKEQLLDEMSSFRGLDGPLDMLINHFGYEAVAEVTGRSRRVVWSTGDTGRKKVVQKRSRQHAEADAAEFMGGRKRILVFSEAGGTGQSFHADNTVKNKQKRMHYLVQPGWRADVAIQGLGRSHRTNQATEPHYFLCTTDVPAQARFISTIARRLDQLGALTRGQRQTGSQGFFQARDNLENQHARDAFRILINDIARGEVEGLSIKEFEEQLGLKLTDQESGAVHSELPATPQFLNRTLSLELETMERVFSAYMERLDQVVEHAEQQGTLDVGMETIRGDSIESKRREVVRTDEVSGAETIYHELAVTNPAKIRKFDDVRKAAKKYLVNKKSGRIWAVVSGVRTKTDTERGRTEEYYTLWSPNSVQHADRYDVDYPGENSYQKFREVEEGEARRGWDKEVKGLPQTKTDSVHIVSGSLLPIWDRLPGENPRVLRAKTNDGQVILGRMIPEGLLPDTLEALGVGAGEFDAADSVQRVLKEHAVIRLANGWTITRRLVSGEIRLELKGPDFSNHAEMDILGVFRERHNYTMWYFIPVDKAGGVVESLAKNRPIISVAIPEGSQYMRTGRQSAKGVGGDHGRITEDSRRLQAAIEKDIGKRLPEGAFTEVDLSDPVSKGLEAVAGVFGKRVVAFAAAPEVDVVFSGVVIPGDPNTIFVEASSEKPHLVVLGHELTHTMRNDHEDLYSVLARAVMDEASGFDRYKARLDAIRKEQGAGASTEDQALAELTADVVGGHMTDPAFWDAVARQEPGIFEKLAKVVKRFINKVLSKLGIKHGSHEFIKDIARVNDAVDYAMAEYAKRQGGKWAASEARGEGSEPMYMRRPRSERTAADAAASMQFGDPETEERFQQARKGLRAPGNVWAKIKEKLRWVYLHATKHYPDLPNTKQFAEAREALRQLEAAPTNAKTQAVHALEQITEGLTPNEYELFTRKVILDDLKFEASREHALPFGFTPETLEEDSAAVDEKVTQSPAVQEALRQRADVLDVVKEQLLEAGVMDEEQFKNPHYFRHQVLSYAMERTITQGGRNVKKPKPGYAKRRHGSMEDINASYIEAEFEYLHRALIDVKTSETIDRLATRYDIKDDLKKKASDANKKAFEELLDHDPDLKARAEGVQGDGLAIWRLMQEALGERLKTWKDFIPDGYTLWQPDPGNIFYTGKSLPEKAMDHLIAVAETQGLPGVPQTDLQEVVSKIRDSILLGGKKRELAMPEELVTTIEGFASAPTKGLMDQIFRKPLSAWKIWVLINPRRVIKYNLNNLSGDLDAVIAGSPKAILKLPRAIKELWQAMQGEMAPRYQEALERGVFDTGLTIQEVPDINRLDKLARLHKRPTLANLPQRAVLNIWSALKGYTQFRENWLRHAAYLDYAERLEKGESMESIGYGAAYKPLVDGLHDPKDRAALLARELVGDYGNISALGQELRAKVIPFYSWIEINTGRYLRLFANAYSQGIGEGIKTMGVTATLKGTKVTAYLGLRMFLFYGLVQAWNNLVFGDEEDELDETERVRLHLNLGRDEDGKIRTMRFQGALSDFLQWVGFEESIGVAVEIQKGRADLTDLLATIGKAPVNKVAGGITPLIRTPAELASGRSFWPDVFNPRTIRDKSRETFRLFSMENEYDWLFNRPTKGYWRSWEQALVYKKDTGEIAYRTIQDRKHDWKNKVKGVTGSSDYSSPRSRAMRDYKMAKRFEDKDAERAALKRLGELGVKPLDFIHSIRAAHPLYGLSKVDKIRFLSTLDQDEKKQVFRAIRWYNEVYWGSRNLPVRMK